MTCQELLKVLNDYIDGPMDRAVCEEFADHLTGCNPCKVVVDTLRMTITLYKSGKPYPLPPELELRLHQQLLQRWREKFGQA